MKKADKTKLIFLLFMLLIFIIGIVGWFAPYGYARWNFFFENLIFFPVELIITVVVINKLLERVENEREFIDYYDIAEEALSDVQLRLKGSMVMGHTGKIILCREKYDSSFEELSTKFDNFVNREVIESGLWVKKSELVSGKLEIIDKQVSLLENVAQHTELLLKELRDHVSMYSRIIPIDIHNSLIKIIRFLEKNELYSDDQIGLIFRKNILQAYESETMTEVDYEGLIEMYKQYFKEYQKLVDEFDTLIEKKSSA